MKLAPLLTVAAVVLVIAVVVSLNVERLYTVAGMAAVACVLYTVCGLAIGYAFARMFRMELRSRKAMTFIIGIQGGLIRNVFDRA